MVVSVFGLFSGQEILCSKGIQSKTGFVKVLSYREVYSQEIPFISKITDNFFPPQKVIKNRIVLINEGSVTYLPYFQDIDLKAFKNSYVIVTGDLNTCRNELKIKDPLGIEKIN